MRYFTNIPQKGQNLNPDPDMTIANTWHKPAATVGTITYNADGKVTIDRGISVGQSYASLDDSQSHVDMGYRIITGKTYAVTLDVSNIDNADGKTLRLRIIAKYAAASGYSTVSGDGSHSFTVTADAHDAGYPYDTVWVELDVAGAGTNNAGLDISNVVITEQ